MGKDMVNSPEHYNQSEIECIDALRSALGEEGFVAYCRGNAIKYNWRAGHKFDTTEDLKKAAWYSSMAAGDDPRTCAAPAEEVVDLTTHHKTEYGMLLEKHGIKVRPGQVFAICKHSLLECKECDVSIFPMECDTRGSA